MKDYKSPITIIQDQLHRQVEMDMENGILKAIQRYGIEVDKDELLKALEYDRNQYDKGYKDGLNADKWIPCEQMLPEESLNSVIGWDEYRKRCCFVQYYKGQWHLGNDIESVKITAWQPLPDPYMKEGEENECR